MNWIPVSRKDTKLKSIGENVDDPYMFGPGLGITDFMPEVEYPAIYNFLINTPSPYEITPLGVIPIKNFTVLWCL